MKLDDVDKSLLDIIQSKFPLSREPFSELGKELGIRDREAIQRVEKLKNARIIRMIGPVFNPRMVGYQTTLAAMKVPTSTLSETARIMATHPMVSHCYLREHDFNLWFTIAFPTEDDIDSKVLKLGNILKVEATVNLPAVRMFKIVAFFRLGSAKNNAAKKGHSSAEPPDKRPSLSLADRRVINELQQDLPLTLRPFDFMSNNSSMVVDKFLSTCDALIKRKIMRRYSASVNHNNIGFTANAMTCWRVPPNLVESVGKKIAGFPEVSHCYERRTGTLWPYNLFAMIHADTREKCQALARRISVETELDGDNPIILFSTKEIKKTRIKYLV
ncbi:MAG: Lrp/AsnC family transcriptional regulator [Chloroflexi bacterium]|nr:Lrp/AsnC family transcriptional regulator [Chloroflexota bacterium]MBM3172206.1 Lrp/AsnC family transcriptional regulator [Chloroflexota bacterium]MBM3174198.1 Lrp/AsnC family transcriptional regulator [Chloroflexota bacterium]